MLSIRELPIKLTSLLSFIFFFSGFVALIYQVVWQRLLTTYYGVGAISITLIVSVYMVGLGLGALCGGFLAERVKNKIILYFVVELLIGCFGLISLPFLDFLGQYTAGSSYLVSFCYMFLFLSVPTFLMGVTLPLLTKLFNRLIHNFLDTISFLYFINTIGAAAGAIFSSYVIITFFGLDTAIYFAVTVNFILAALIFLGKYFPVDQPEQGRPGVLGLHNDQNDIFGRVAYPLVFITGFLAIGYEIVWFRVVGVLVKASPYAFSTTLSVYLLGIAIGSIYMSSYLKANTQVNKKSLFFFLQFLIGISVALIITGYYYLTRYTFVDILTKQSFSNILHPPVNVNLGDLYHLGNLYDLFDIFLWPAIFVFVPTLLMGASFPLISLLALSQRNKEGQTVGIVYFFNIFGNVLGGIVTGFLLLPHLGTELTLLSFSGLGICIGIFISRLGSRQIILVHRVGVVFILLVITVIVFPQGGQLYKVMHPSPAEEFNINPNNGSEEVITYTEEGRDGIIVTHQYHEKMKNYINGLSHGGRGFWYGHQYEAIEAASFAPKVENILLIGYGTGDTARIVLTMKDAHKVTIVELNDTLIKNLKKVPVIKKELSDSRVNLIIEDGRRFLLRTNEKFDLILIDPIRTTTSYSNNLYSHQFFQIINQHLTSGGVFMVWLNEHRVLPKTIQSAFNFVRMYKFFALASNAGFKKNDERQKRIMAGISIPEQEELLKLETVDDGLYLGNEDYVKALTENYPINHDWKPVNEYYLGLKLKGQLFYKKEASM